jgi:hypothetical protein
VSSKARRKRLERVQHVWEEDLGRCVAALGDARARADVAQAHLDEARAKTRAARGAKADLLGGASAEEWRTREAWLATCGVREEKAILARAGADSVVAQALGAVTLAHQKIERLKLVLVRIAQADAAGGRRADRITEDESSARMSRGSS